MKSDPEPEFDAVAAARELDDLLSDTGKPDSGGSPMDAEYITSLERDIEQMTVLLAQKDEEIRRANARADQAHAEIEAVQRRASTSAEKELDQRTRKLLEGFLPVVDNIDRAVAAAKAFAQGPQSELLAGVELVRRELLKSLASYGVTHAPARGERFDPNRHEAIAVVPVTDAAQDGIVIDVLREGYLIGEATLRPAGVAVGKRTG